MSDNSKELRADIVVSDAEVREIWAETMRDMSRNGVETQLSKWELLLIVEGRHRGIRLPKELLERRESAVNSLIESNIGRVLITRGGS